MYKHDCITLVIFSRCMTFPIGTLRIKTVNMFIPYHVLFTAESVLIICIETATNISSGVMNVLVI